MRTCSYIYCRAPLEDADAPCPVCGHPGDDAALLDPARLAHSQVEGLPDEILDLHQILPSHEGMLDVQLLAMKTFGISRALLQSVPDQAHSLCGNARLLDVAGERPDSFWISQFVDPRTPDAEEKLDEVVEAGAKVIKLLPPAGFRLDDPAHEPFLARMEELELVAMVHTGFITARHKDEEARAGAYLSSVYADPLTLDRPARRVPPAHHHPVPPRGGRLARGGRPDGHAARQRMGRRERLRALRAAAAAAQPGGRRLVESLLGEPTPSPSPTP